MFSVYSLNGVLVISKARKKNQRYLSIKRFNVNLSYNNIARENFWLHTVSTGPNDAIAIRISILRWKIYEFIRKSLVIQGQTSSRFSEDMNAMDVFSRFIRW